MDERLRDVLEGKEDNYLFPFFWQHGGATERLAGQIKMIRDSGCRAFCVESKSHPEFCRDGWWRDMDVILAQAKKLGMKVWILDDDKFPTGHAAGAIEKKYPHLRQTNLVETHVDVLGPAKDISVLTGRSEKYEESLLGAFAYRRVDGTEDACEFEGIDLTSHVRGDLLYWDVPEGLWRIFFYFRSRRGGWNKYIDVISPESVRVLIDEVYESHWEHYGDYFGSTVAGFFSDEPAFANQMFRAARSEPGFYEKRIGTPGLALPWNENVLKMMKEKLGFDPTPHLDLLWYEDGKNGDDQAEIRFSYMDSVTRLYSECFTKQLGDWCRAHGVMYTGHVIEDMDSHTRLFHCAGHYFRDLAWQDMSGVDIVFQQVLPGMARSYHTSSAVELADGEFFHYVLAKLGASLAHLTPSMRGKAMCEMFGAYGWGLDTPLMKFIVDFLLVRGINRFVPHAFSDRFPDAEFPPHFAADGKNPSFEGFSALMRYVNKAAHLLDGAVHRANAAILYNAEGEWAGRRNNAMTVGPIASRLYDAHIDYDVVPADMLCAHKAENGRLRLADEAFDCLVVPYSDHLPAETQGVLKSLSDAGLKVWFFGAAPENALFEAEVILPEELVPTMKRLGMTDVTVDGDHPYLRIYHCVRGGNDVYMFFNESVTEDVDTTVRLKSVGEYACADLLNERFFGGETSDGLVRIRLAKNQSLIMLFGDRAGFEDEPVLKELMPLTPRFDLGLADWNDISSFRPLGSFDGFFNVNGPDRYPDFSGKMKYSFSLELPTDGKRLFLDLGRVGQNAELYVNGSYAGIRVAEPYVFEITPFVKEGENSFTAVVSNTLVRQFRDPLSRLLTLAPSGLLGGMKLMTC